jgi:hypothetical protein
VKFRLVFLGTMAVALLLAQRRVWVIRGAGFLVLAALLAAADGLSGVLFRAPDWFGWAAFWLVPVGAGAAAWNSWLVSADAAGISRIVEDAGRTVWMPCEKSLEGYEFRPGDAHLRLRLKPAFTRCVILTFSSRRKHKKMELLKKLLFKRCPPLFPRPKFRI